MADTKKKLLILGENPLEQIWATLGLWESVSIAKQSILTRANEEGYEISNELLESKAIALSYCLRNARDNLKSSNDGLTSRAISNYYGCMWFASAVLVSDFRNEIDLTKLEKSTKSGHGLGNAVDDRLLFPDNELIYIKQSGFFFSYLTLTSLSSEEAISLTLSNSKADKVEKVEDKDYKKFARLLDLFSRVPELKDSFEYATGKRAPLFSAYYSSANHAGPGNFDKLIRIFDSTAPVENEPDFTWIGFADGDISKDFIAEFGPQLEEIELCIDGKYKYWHGKLFHPAGEPWDHYINLYRSGISQTTWINPLFGKISDPIAIHLMLSYHISILSRYRPAIWREIIEGKFDTYKTIISLYNQIFPRVITELVLRRISGRNIQITVPGTMQAPI